MYEIPKEIKSKPKLFGLEIKEFGMLLLSFFIFFTMLRDLVHGVFMIPYCIVSGCVILWMFLPSRNNPRLKNYMSIFLYFKRDQQAYHPLDTNKVMNDYLIDDLEGDER